MRCRKRRRAEQSFPCLLILQAQLTIQTSFQPRTVPIFWELWVSLYCLHSAHYEFRFEKSMAADFSLAKIAPPPPPPLKTVCQPNGEQYLDYSVKVQSNKSQFSSEIDAFSTLVSAFRAQGPLTNYKDEVLQHVKAALLYVVFRMRISPWLLCWIQERGWGGGNNWWKFLQMLSILEKKNTGV